MLRRVTSAGKVSRLKRFGFNFQTGFAVLLAVVLVVPAIGQKQKNRPYSELPVIQKKEVEQPTQVLPAGKDSPPAISVETGRLVFSTVPLSGKGLLSQQTREAMRGLVRNRNGATIAKLRAFVAGSGDARRILDIAGEVFGDKHLPLPVLSVVQVGALPLEGAQVAMEVVSVDKKVSNPSGLGFFSAQKASGLSGAASQLRDEFRKAGLDASDAVRVTCFVNSLEAAGDWHGPLAGFSGAAVNVVQMMREAYGPPAACEAVARLRSVPTQAVTALDPLVSQSAAVLVNTPNLILTGIQLAFGAKNEDVRQGYDRISRVLAASNARFSDVVFVSSYLLLSSDGGPLETIRAELSNQAAMPAVTVLPFEGLSSIEASVGLDVVAVAR